MRRNMQFLEDDIIYPESEYRFFVATTAGYAVIRTEETQWDVPAPVTVDDMGSVGAMRCLEALFSAGAIGMTGKPVSLQNSPPADIYNALLMANPDLILSFDLVEGFLPEDIPVDDGPMQLVAESAGYYWRDDIRNAGSVDDIKRAFIGAGLLDYKLETMPELPDPPKPTKLEIYTESVKIVDGFKSELQSLWPKRSKLDRERKDRLREDIEWFETEDGKKDLRERAENRLSERAQKENFIELGRMEIKPGIYNALILSRGVGYYGYVIRRASLWDENDKVDIATVPSYDIGSGVTPDAAMVNAIVDAIVSGSSKNIPVFKKIAPAHLYAAAEKYAGIINTMHDVPYVDPQKNRVLHGRYTAAKGYLGDIGRYIRDGRFFALDNLIPEIKKNILDPFKRELKAKAEKEEAERKELAATVEHDERVKKQRSENRPILEAFFKNIKLKKHEYSTAWDANPDGGGKRTVSGWRYGELFAVHKEDGRGSQWSVTHLPTGRAVGRGIASKVQAAEWAWRLDKMGDVWKFNDIADIPDGLSSLVADEWRKMQDAEIPEEIKPGI